MIIVTNSVPNKTKLSRQQGSVLVAVLAVILLLSFITSRFMQEAVEDLEYRALFNPPDEVRNLAYSVLAASLANVQEIALLDNGKLYAAEQGWSNPIRYAQLPIPDGWEVQVILTDASGKLPLNSIPEPLLLRLLEEQLQFDFSTARQLSSALLDWIDADEVRRLNGAESDSYLNRIPPYRCANRPIIQLAELQRIQTWDKEFFDATGKPKPVYQQLEQLVSTHYIGPVNLNSAPPAVVQLLAQHDGFDAQSIFDGLEQPYLKKAPSAANPNTSGTEVRLLQITIKILRGHTPYTISALVEPVIEMNALSQNQNNSTQLADEITGLRSGTLKQQIALQYPFEILSISHHNILIDSIISARSSILDITERQH